MFIKKTHFIAIGLCAVLSYLPTTASAWYIRLEVVVAKARLQDRGNVLGQVVDAKRNYDLHDLIEFKPFAAPYLTLVFPHSDWASKAGSYATDFHSLSAKTDSWVFDVRTDVSNRKVTLSWSSDDSRRLSKSRLIDSTTGKTIIIKPNKSYSFTMTGQTTRSFVWKVLR